MFTICLLIFMYVSLIFMFSLFYLEFNEFYLHFIDFDWFPGFGSLGLDSWVWTPGLGFLGLESWAWIPGPGFLDLDSWPKLDRRRCLNLCVLNRICKSWGPPHDRCSGGWGNSARRPVSFYKPFISWRAHCKEHYRGRVDWRRLEEIPLILHMRYLSKNPSRWT